MAKDGKPKSEDIAKEGMDDDRYLNLKSSALDSDEEEEGTGDGETDHYANAFQAIQDGDGEAFSRHMKKAHGK